MSKPSAIVPKTHQLIGREAEERILHQAIEGDSLCVVYITGEAGVGKTRLLENLPAIIGKCSNYDKCLWSKKDWIIDLYDPEKHSNSGLEAAITRVLKGAERKPEPRTQQEQSQSQIERFIAYFNAVSRE